MGGESKACTKYVRFVNFVVTFTYGETCFNSQVVEGFRTAPHLANAHTGESIRPSAKKLHHSNEIRSKSRFER